MTREQLREAFRKHIRLVMIDPNDEDSGWRVKPASEEEFYDAILAFSPPCEPTKWQPIETAPKDGTQILGCWKTDVMDVIFFSPGGTHNREWANEEEFVSTPPYWQPLPAGPDQMIAD